jgi:hypothetical protein
MKTQEASMAKTILFLCAVYLLTLFFTKESPAHPQCDDGTPCACQPLPPETLRSGACRDAKKPWLVALNLEFSECRWVF